MELVGVIGGGTMGAGIAEVCAKAGSSVLVLETKEEFAAAARERIAKSINRGVALFGELVFVGTMDSRLVAIHKDTGQIVWETKVIDWQQGYSITGAPLVVKDLVLTGVAGGEFGIRGFVKAFDVTPRLAISSSW